MPATPFLKSKLEGVKSHTLGRALYDSVKAVRKYKLGKPIKIVQI